MAKVKVPYFVWRAGRPRWEPGPHVRALGFKGRDLRDDAGDFLSEGRALDAARALNREVEQVRLGGTSAAPAKTHPSRRSLTELFRLYRSSPGYTRDIAPRTRQGYRLNLETLEDWGGHLNVAHITRDEIRRLHAELTDTRGLATANAIMRTFKMVVYYALNELEWIFPNRMAKLRFEEPDGRRVIWEVEEIEAFLAAAEYLGLEAQGDALMLGLLTGQRRGDILTQPPLRLEDGVYRIRQRKTDAMAYVPATQLLTARLALMRKRKAKAWPNVAFRHELIQDVSGKPYGIESSDFGYEFRAVRAIAAGGLAVEDICRALGGLPPVLRNLPFTPTPSILDKHFADLRDTAVTWLFDAGCDEARIATITGHSLVTVRTILDKHYFVRHAGLARSAGHLLDAFLAKQRMG